MMFAGVPFNVSVPVPDPLTVTLPPLVAVSVPLGTEKVAVTATEPVPAAVKLMPRVSKPGPL